MPEHLRALIVISVIALIVFSVFRKLICETGMSVLDFRRRQTTWFAITAAVFLAHNYWVYIIACSIILIVAQKKEKNPTALYFFVMFAAPNIDGTIPGLGILESLFSINYLRLLSLLVLLPALYRSFIEHSSSKKIRRKEKSSSGLLLPEYFLLGYLGLLLALNLAANTFTNSLRIALFYSFLDAVLPFMVAARLCKTQAQQKDALLSLGIAFVVLSGHTFFEFIRGWNLYMSLNQSLATDWGAWANTGYLARGELLRASGSTGHPLGMGFISVFGVTCAVGIFLYGTKQKIGIGFAAMALMGLLSSVSRGPFLAAAISIIGLVLLKMKVKSETLSLALIVSLGIYIFSLTPAWSGVAQYLPFLGDVDSETIDYRKQLLEIGVEVVMQNPIFGAYDYIYSPAMQELRQGQGIIDIVNQYLGIALSAGLVGLFLFLGISFTVLAAQFKVIAGILKTRNVTLPIEIVISVSALIGCLVSLAGGNLGHLSGPMFYTWLGLSYAISQTTTHLTTLQRANTLTEND